MGTNWMAIDTELTKPVITGGSPVLLASGRLTVSLRSAVRVSAVGLALTLVLGFQCKQSHLHVAPDDLHQTEMISIPIFDGAVPRH